jgi:hypothetical protein
MATVRAPHLLVSGFVLLVAGAIAIWRLHQIPFGPTFIAALGACIGGLLLLLSTAAFQLLRRRTWLPRLAGGLLAVLLFGIVLGLATAAIDHRILLTGKLPSRMTPDRWSEDLDVLAEAMRTGLPDLAAKIDPDEFNAEVAGLRERLPELERRVVEAELARIVALPNDAHSYPNVFSFALDWHFYPLRLYDFDDGVHVIDAGREWRDLVGARLVSINGQPVAEVSHALRPYLAAENDSAWRERFASIGLHAEWLYAAGVTDDPRRARFRFEMPSGAEREVRLPSYHYVPVFLWSQARRVPDDAPVAINSDRQTNYRFHMLPDGETLYFQFNRAVEEPGQEPLAEFIDRFREQVSANPFERLVIDLRNNDGGNSRVLEPLVTFLTETPEIRARGPARILIGRKTFSAAVMFAVRIQNRMPVVFFGEATGQGPIFFGGPQPVRLPNSGMEFLLSSHLTVAGLPQDRRKAIKPDVLVPYTHRDYLAGRDPALEGALSWSADARVPAAAAIRWDAYAGRYSYGPCRILLVTLGPSGPHLQISDFMPGNPVLVETDLHPQGGRRFVSDSGHIEFEFAEPERGFSSEITVRLAGAEHRASRREDRAMLPAELLRVGRYEDAAEELMKARDLYLDQMPNLEHLLNQHGYDLLRDEDAAAAVEVFRINTRLFPDSWNARDSLAEGFLRGGDKEQAATYYRKSLTLNPENRGAAETLAKLTSEG